MSKYFVFEGPDNLFQQLVQLVQNIYRCICQLPPHVRLTPSEMARTQVDRSKFSYQYNFT